MASMSDWHADVTGSLLRPSWLLAARERYQKGWLTAAELKRTEDRAVRMAVAMQEGAGLAVVTDGEMRRLSFQSQVVSAIDGFGEWDLAAFVWGHWRGDGELGDWRAQRPEGLAVGSPLKRRASIAVEEFAYLRAVTGVTPKVTLPSPGLFTNFWDPQRSANAYPRLQDFLAEVAAILRAEVEELAALGARYIQIDAPHYPLLLDEATRAFYESQGWTMREWLKHGVALDNHVMAPIADVTFGLHLCRGNQASRWLVAGDYGPIAEPIFAGTAAHRLLLEYDDDRSGGFAPLSAVPADKTVVLGLVSTKQPSLEDPEELMRCIDSASRRIDGDRLAISTQCGFSTSVLGNSLSLDDQAAKLALVADTAHRYWR